MTNVLQNPYSCVASRCSFISKSSMEQRGQCDLPYPGGITFNLYQTTLKLCYSSRCYPKISYLTFYACVHITHKKLFGNKIQNDFNFSTCIFRHYKLSRYIYEINRCRRELENVEWSLYQIQDQVSTSLL